MVRQGRHPAQNLRQAPPRDGAVHAVIVRRDAPHRRERRLAPRPEGQPLVLAGRDPRRHCPVCRSDLGHLLDQIVTFRIGPIEFDDQQGLNIERIARMDKGLCRMDGGAVHHLHPRRNDPRRDHIGHALTGALNRLKAKQEGARCLRLGQDAHRHLGDHAQQPLRADDNTQKIKARRVQMLATQTHHLPVHHHHLDAEHIVGGQAIFEAMDPAGILRHIAADRTGDLAGRVGRIVEAAILDRAGDGQIGHPRLHHRHAAVIVNIQHLIELGQAQQDPVFQRQGPARQRGPRPARHHLDPRRVTPAQDRRHLRRRFGQDHDQRHLAIGRQPIGLIGPQRGRIRDHPLTRHNPPQGRHNLPPPRQNRPIGHRHLHKQFP